MLYLSLPPRHQKRQELQKLMLQASSSHDFLRHHLLYRFLSRRAKNARGSTFFKRGSLDLGLRFGLRTLLAALQVVSIRNFFMAVT